MVRDLPYSPAFLSALALPMGLFSGVHPLNSFSSHTFRLGNLISACSFLIRRSLRFCKCVSYSIVSDVQSFEKRSRFLRPRQDNPPLFHFGAWHVDRTLLFRRGCVATSRYSVLPNICTRSGEIVKLVDS